MQKTNSAAFRKPQTSSGARALEHATQARQATASVANLAASRKARRSPDQMLSDCPTAEAQVAYILQRIIGKDRQIMAMLKDAHPSARASLRALHPDIDRLANAVEQQEQSQQSQTPRLRTA